jgi:hypothetical protein
MIIKSLYENEGIFLLLSSYNSPLGVRGKKNPDSKVGGPNQKPLTIKPYPMKIQS